MKFYRYVTSRLYSSQPLSISKVNDLLSENLPISREIIDSILFFYGKKLGNIPPNRIIQNCELCRNLNIELNPITNISSILQQNSIILKHKIFLLQEMGVPVINLALISRISKDMKISANDFKKKTNIPKNQHIMTNLTSHIVEQASNLPPLTLLDESLPLVVHYEQCILYYTIVNLGINDKRLYNQGRRYKSIRMMLRMLKLLKENIGVDEEYIRNQPSILDLCPDNAETVIQSLENIGINITTLQHIIKKKPEILSYDPKNIKKILQSLKKYELPVNAVNNCLELLKVKHNVFENRMKYFLSLPDIKIWSKNAHILHCIIHDKKVKERIKHLNQAGLIKWAHIKIFTSTEKKFAKSCQEEFNYTKKQRYIKYILCKELGSDKHHVIDLVMRHPYWNRIAYIDIDNTLCRLKENFTEEDICNNIQLILYPWSLINRQLQKIQKFDCYNDNTILTPSQCLALCLYLIERANHFTGDGVWNPLDIEERQKREQLPQNNVLYNIDKTVDLLKTNQFCMISQHTKYSDVES